MSDSTIQWRPVVGYEGLYEVSDTGLVCSLDRAFTHTLSGTCVRRGKILARKIDKRGGRCRVRLTVHQRTKLVSVHRIVLEAFVGPCPPDMEGCHGDGDFHNNSLTNLRWDTKSANQFDSVRHGTHLHAKKTQCVHGHEFSPANTYVAPSTGQRVCRTCYRAYDQRRDRRGRRRYEATSQKAVAA